MGKVQGPVGLVPPFGGLAVGAIVAGGPLGYYVNSLQTQLQDVSALASERDSTVASLESKLKAVNLAAADTAEQVRGASSEATANAHQLEEQRALSRELAKPELPLQLEVHKGLLTSGYVLQIRNPGRNDIAVAATFQSPDSHKMERGLVIDAGVGVNIGELEG
jgi:hypothetical protein